MQSRNSRFLWSCLPFYRSGEKKRIRSVLRRTFCAAAGLLLAVSVTFGLCACASPEEKADTNDYSVSGNLDVMRNLTEKTWRTLSEEEKIRTLRTICVMESRRLGMPWELQVSVEDLPENITAQYENATHTVYLSRKRLDDSASTVLKSLLHESYHGYQYALVELYDSLDPRYQNLLAMRDIQQYKEEFGHYQYSGSDREEPDEEQYEAYASQLIEETAKRYADSAMKSYYKEIAEAEKQPVASGAEQN